MFNICFHLFQGISYEDILYFFEDSFQLFELIFLVLVLLLAIFLWQKLIRRDNINYADFAGRYVFITGCDTGFGNQAARTFDRIGFRVIASCMTEKGAEDLKATASQRLLTVLLDVTDTKNVQQVAKMVRDKVGEKGKGQNN